MGRVRRRVSEIFDQQLHRCLNDFSVPADRRSGMYQLRRDPVLSGIGRTLIPWVRDQVQEYGDHNGLRLLMCETNWYARGSVIPLRLGAPYVIEILVDTEPGAYWPVNISDPI